MSFAKHQTFHIRDGWLRKGMVAVKNDPGIFLSEKAPEQLGLGVNMVGALRFWMVATGLTEKEYENRRRVQHLTSFGKRVLEYDEYLEEDGTLWLIHYHLAKNPAEATTWYWFFNHSAKLVFDKEQFVSELDFWIRQTESKEVSRRSLERDFDCFLRTYLPSDRALSPEDTIECPLSALELLSADNTKDEKRKTYRFLKPSVARFHPLIALYVIKRWQKEERFNAPQITFGDVLRSPANAGRVFNLDASSLSELFGRLNEEHPDFSVYLTRTEGLDTLSLPNVSSEAILDAYYVDNIQLTLSAPHSI